MTTHGNALAAGPARLRAAFTLALDVEAARVIRHFEGVRLAAVLLKGPAVVAYLYPQDADQRAYVDIDLLVSPPSFAAACSALRDLGYENLHIDGSPMVGAGQFEWPWRLAEDKGSWGQPGLVVDLHRGFHGVGAPERFWEMLHASAGTLRVAGADVKVPDKSGCALILALHAWLAPPDGRPIEDLSRALEEFGDDIWAQAGSMASACDASGPFAAGLSKLDAGRDLMTRLDISRAAPPVVWMRSGGEMTSGVGLLELIEVPGWSKRLARLPRLAVPGKEFMREWARLHPVGEPPRPPAVPRAYLLRSMAAVKAAPALLVHMRKSAQAAAASGWQSASKLPTPGKGVTSRGSGALQAARLVVWAWRAHGEVHRRLPHTGLDGEMLMPAPPRAAMLTDVEGDRAVRSVLGLRRASCLEEALVRQAWLSGRGTPRDIVIGVTAPSDGFRAHAWLEGDAVGGGYVEMFRQPANRWRSRVRE
jgi:hypothetical protein